MSVLAGTGDNARHLLVVFRSTLSESALIVNHQNGSWFRQFVARNLKFLPAVRARKQHTPRDSNVSRHMQHARGCALNRPYSDIIHTEWIECERQTVALYPLAPG